MATASFITFISLSAYRAVLRARKIRSRVFFWSMSWKPGRITALAEEDEGVGAEAPLPEERDEAPYEPVLDVVVGVGAQAGLALAVDRAVGDVDPIEAVVDGHHRPPRHEHVREGVKAHAGSVVVFPEALAVGDLGDVRIIGVHRRQAQEQRGGAVVSPTFFDSRNRE
jgi:hypothetical protein